MISAWVSNSIGSGAAFCTTVSFLPQLIRVWRLKSARDISIVMFLLFSVGLALWLAYGLMIHSWPVILSNGCTLLFSLAILGLKVKYDRRDARLLRSGNPQAQ
ncbi:MAG TPA: SemiSWEET transporter [Acidisarcina sp.]|nr:SemiSWEET transporter [Acidisarcina sp.]